MGFRSPSVPPWLPLEQREYRTAEPLGREHQQPRGQRGRGAPRSGSGAAILLQHREPCRGSTEGTAGSRPRAQLWAPPGHSRGHSRGHHRDTFGARPRAQLRAPRNTAEGITEGITGTPPGTAGAQPRASLEHRRGTAVGTAGARARPVHGHGPAAPMRAPVRPLAPLSPWAPLSSFPPLSPALPAPVPAPVPAPLPAPVPPVSPGPSLPVPLPRPRCRALPVTRAVPAPARSAAASWRYRAEVGRAGLAGDGRGWLGARVPPPLSPWRRVPGSPSSASPQQSAVSLPLHLAGRRLPGPGPA